MHCNQYLTSCLKFQILTENELYKTNPLYRNYKMDVASWDLMNSVPVLSLKRLPGRAVNAKKRKNM